MCNRSKYSKMNRHKKSYRLQNMKQCKGKIWGKYLTNHIGFYNVRHLTNRHLLMVNHISIFVDTNM